MLFFFSYTHTPTLTHRTRVCVYQRPIPLAAFYAKPFEFERILDKTDLTDAPTDVK